VHVGDESINHSDQERQERDNSETWVDNIKMNLKETEYEGLDCNDVAQDRDQWWDPLNKVTKLGIPLKKHEFLD